MAPRRIQLVVTGDLEKLALAASLQALFGNEDASGREVVWLPARKVHGATSHRLKNDSPLSSAMVKLAKAAVVEAVLGATGVPADLVLAIDDLELMNAYQPAMVCEHFRRATVQVAETEQVRQGTPRVGRPSVKQLIRERCSFHLLSPMMESYFFGDHAALRRSGCTLPASPMLRDKNWEDFWCCDPDSKQRISARNHEMRVVHNLPFWEEERHAKHYLEELIARSGGTPYEETVGGAAALRQLDWPRVLDGSPTHCPLVQALMDDLSAFFQRPSPLPPRAPSAVRAARPAKPGSRQVLRNM